ncbi:hypothetical protein QTO17_21970 [Vibrio owensii]
MKLDRYFWLRDVKGLVLIMVLVSVSTFALKRLLEFDGALYPLLVGISVAAGRSLLADYLKVPKEKGR